MKLHYLMVLGEANLAVILFCPDLLTGVNNGPPLERPKEQGYSLGVL